MAARLRFVLVVCLLATACSKKQEPELTHDEAPAPTNRIAVPETVRRNLGIDFVKVERRRVAQTLGFSGHFELLMTARHELRTPVQGRVTLLVKPLQAVQAGDAIYRFEMVEYPDRAEAVLAGSAGVDKRLNEGTTNYRGTGLLRLVDRKTQKTIWAHEYQRGFMFGGSVSTRVANQMADQLLKDAGAAK